MQPRSQNIARRRGRPRKNDPPAPLSKVGYDPNPTVIDDPPECDERFVPNAPARRTTFGAGEIPEEEMTPSRVPEIATPLPDFSTPSRTENPKMEPHFPKDLGGEDFDVQPSALEERMKEQTRINPFGHESFRLPSRSVLRGTNSPVRRRTPPLPEAPLESEETPKKTHHPPVKRCDGAQKKNHSEQIELYRDGALCGWLDNPEYGNASMGNAREQFHCISIIGQIEGHSLLPEGQKATKYEHIIPTLVSVEEDDRVDGLLVILNTMGGDVEAGLAIAEMIASMTKPTVSLVLGGGHSIGVPLATAADYSLIVPSATMTIHPVRVSGMVIGVPQSFRYMSEMQDRITKFICSHSKAKPEVIHELMMRPDQIATDCGSILEGDEAVRYGIIDEVGGLDRALSVLRELCKKRKK